MSSKTIYPYPLPCFLPPELHLKIDSFLGNPAELAQNPIPEALEKPARAPKVFVPLFDRLVVPLENQRGCDLATHIITRLSLNPNSEPRIPAVLAALQALREHPEGKVKISFPPKNCETPVALARAYFRDGWVKALAQACGSLERIKTLKSLLQADSRASTWKSAIARNQLCQVVQRTAINIVRRDPGQESLLDSFHAACLGCINRYTDPSTISISIVSPYVPRFIIASTTSNR